MNGWLRRAADRLQPQSGEAAPPLDMSVVIVLLSAPVLLTLRQYVFTASHIKSWLADARFDGYLHVPQHDRLLELTCWALGQAVCYFVLPALVIKLALRESLADYGLKLHGATQFWWAYAGMYLAMLPLIFWMATTREFQAMYPFYDPPRGEPLWPRFWTWQLLYWLQFLSLEFFFRGYLLHGTRRAIGPYAILVSTIPYCMIHYGKPLPETLGAIVAGVILGTMSYATRSIWFGAALHIAVAVTMDLAALWNEGRFAADVFVP